MSELWTDEWGTFTITTRHGLPRKVTPEQVAAFTTEPPPTSEGPTCETCLRLANRDRREDDGSTWTEPVP